jgi:hypothetical protein
MVTGAMLALLDALGANEARPGMRPLMEHLEGTRAVLARWGSSTDICLAGLFHSVYGAEGGRARARDANLDRRNDVRALIGPAAEELAYLYAACERRSLFTNPPDAATLTISDMFEKRDVPVAETTLRALLEMEAANMVEGPAARINYPDSLIAQIKAGWENARRFVTARAWADLQERFRAIDALRTAPSRT